MFVTWVDRKIKRVSLALTSIPPRFQDEVIVNNLWIKEIRGTVLIVCTFTKQTSFSVKVSRTIYQIKLCQMGALQFRKVTIQQLLVSILDLIFFSMVLDSFHGGFLFIRDSSTEFGLQAKTRQFATGFTSTKRIVFKLVYCYREETLELSVQRDSTTRSSVTWRYGSGRCV